MSQFLSFISHKGPGLIRLHLADGDVLHLLLVKLLGVVAGTLGKAQDRVETDAAEPGGSAQAAALGEVPADEGGLLRRQGGAEQGGAVAGREVCTAGGAAQAADALGLARPPVGAQRGGATLAVGGTSGIRTRAQRPILLVHGSSLLVLLPR